MAAEIKVSVSLRADKGGATFGPITWNATVDMTGDEWISNVQTVGTTEEAILVGDLATAGYVAIKNLDATNYVHVYGTASDAGPPIKLTPARPFCLFPANSTTIYVKANTAACKCFIGFIEA